MPEWRPDTLTASQPDSLNSISRQLGAFAAALERRYVIQRELGRGGMATVYLARDVGHDRRVALKDLRPELSAIVGGTTSRLVWIQNWTEVARRTGERR